jgi:dTDP-glucose pyrophosphorylase
MGIESDEDVLITYSDTIISKSDMDKIIDFDGNAILANEVENPEKY